MKIINKISSPLEYFQMGFKNNALSKIFFILLTTVIYFIAAKVGMLLSFENANVTPVWPASGVAFALVLITGNLALPGIFLGEFIANFWVFSGNPGINFMPALLVSVFYGIGNVIEPLAGRFFYKKFIKDIYPFKKAKNVFIFLIIAALMCITNSLIGTSAVTLSGISHAKFFNIWITWWVGDFAGVLIVAPILLSFFKEKSFNRKGGLVELLIMFVSLIFFSVIIFSGKFYPEISKAFPYLISPFLLWSVFRFTERDAGINVILFTFIAVIFTVNGKGPFSGYSPNRSLIMLAVFIIIMAVVVYYLLALMFEIKKRDEILVNNKTELEKVVEQRNAELEKIRTSLELAQEISRLGSWDWDILNDNLYWSPELFDLLDVSPKSEPSIKLFMRFLNSQDKQRIKNEIDDMVTGKKVYSNYDISINLSGNKKYLNVMGKTFRHSGKPVRMIGAILDITERKLLEEEKENLILKLERSNESLKKLSEMKENFVAIASHDLRSPFQNILLSTELLLEMEDLTDEMKQYIWIIRNNAKTQLIYINDILDMIHLESGQMKLNIDEIELPALIETAIANMEMIARKKHVDLQYLISGELDNVTVALDYVKIMQVMNNLISNAVKFTNPGGYIDITCLINDKKQIEIHVSDSGIGIPSEKIANIFDKYNQTQNSGTAGEKGTGLGLSICKNIVELHGGTISVKSEPGNGSDFCFTLPLYEKRFS